MGLAVSGYTARNNISFEVDVFFGMNERTCLKPLLERRSIRRFRDEGVPLSKLVEAVEAARHAPSAYNRQPWSFIIIRDRGKIGELASAAPGGVPLRRAPAALAVVVDTRVAPHTHVIDGAVAATYLWLALTCMGLGAVWVEVYGNRRVEEALGLPGHVRAVALFAVGWPAESPPPRPRRPLEELVYLDEYGRLLFTGGSGNSGEER